MGSHNKQYAINTFSLCSLLIILIIAWIAADDGGVFLPSYDRSTDLHQATEQTSSSELYAAAPFSSRALLAVNSLTGSVTRRRQAPVLTQKSPGKKPVLFPVPKTSGSRLSTSSLEAGLFSIFSTFAQNSMRSSTDRQTSCKQGKHNCPPKKNCVDFALTKKEMQMTCVCPEGRFRGENCEDEYKLIDQRDNSSCVKTVNNGEICMCSVDDKNDKNGFCKLRSERVDLHQAKEQTSSSELYAAAPFSSRALLAVNSLTGSVTQRPQAPVLTQKTPVRKPARAPFPKTSGSLSQQPQSPVLIQKSPGEKPVKAPVPTTSGSLTQRPQAPMLTQNSPGMKPAPKTSGSHPLSSSSLEAGLMSILTPLVQTMTRSSTGVLFCWLCKPLARRDCIGLSDKTAYCICTDFSYKNIDAPAVCYFLQAQDNRQTSCKQGKHNCPPKKNCVDYAMTEKEMQITCVCPEGRFRGENCEDEYKLIDQKDNSSCVKTVNNGEICMCSVDDKNDKNGFCKLRSDRVEPKAPVLTQQIPDIKSRRLPVPVGSSPQKETTDEVLPQIEAPVLNQQTPDMKPEIPSVPAESNSRSLLTTEPISNEKSLIKSSSGSSIEITSNASTETGRIQMWQNDLERAKQGTVLQSVDNRILIGIVVAVPVGVLVCVLCFCRRGSSKQVKDKKVTSKGKSKKRERTDGTKDSKHKKKRKKLDADEETNAEKVDVNENSPLQVARGRRSSREYGRLWRYPASRTSSMTKLNLASHNNRNLPGSKQDYVRQYIKRQRFVPGGFIREKCMSRNGFGTLNDADERIPLTRVNFEENGQIYPVRYSKSTFR